MEKKVINTIFLELSWDSFVKTDSWRKSNAYRRYRFNNGHGIWGKIVLEKYGDIWHLELMDVRPTRSGYGTEFLRQVLELEGLQTKDMTVYPISPWARNFYVKQGFLGLEVYKYEEEKFQSSYVEK